MLSRRLEEISNFVDTKNRVIDVGCDHALLGIYLLKEDRVGSVLAIDVNENAIKGAKENKKKYILTDINKKHTKDLKKQKENIAKNLEIMLNDGLKHITLRKTDNIVISGMGTKTIIDILKSSDFKVVETIIIQSNNDLYELRKYMMENGFLIDNEFVVFEKEKYYVIIKFKKPSKEKKKEMKKSNKDEYTFSDLYFGVYTKRYKDYLEHVYEKLNDVYKSIPYTKIHNKFKYKRLVYLAKKRKK